MWLTDWAKLYGMPTSPDTYAEVKEAFLEHGRKEYPFKIILKQNTGTTIAAHKSENLVFYTEWDPDGFPKSYFYFKTEYDAILFKLKWA